jgi:CheY-like chemotaxis protein
MTSSPVSKHKAGILIIDDEPASLEQVLTIPREDGYAVHAANEGHAITG